MNYNDFYSMDLSKNSISSLTGFQHLSKMKQLIANENSINEISFCGLFGLEYISLRQNMISEIPDTQDLRKLVNLDLSHNKLSAGFQNLSKLKSLRVLDLASNGIDMNPRFFGTAVIEPLKQLSKLEYLSFEGNPIERSIPSFRHYIAYELPKLHFLDWVQITKEDRATAAELAAKGTWKTGLVSFGSSSQGNPSASQSPTPGDQEPPPLKPLPTPQQAKAQPTQSQQPPSHPLPKIQTQIQTQVQTQPQAKQQQDHSRPVPGVRTTTSLAALAVAAKAAAAAPPVLKPVAKKASSGAISGASPGASPQARPRSTVMNAAGGPAAASNVQRPVPMTKHSVNAKVVRGKPSDSDLNTSISKPLPQPPQPSVDTASLGLEDMLASLASVSNSNDDSLFDFEEYNERLVREDATKAAAAAAAAAGASGNANVNVNVNANANINVNVALNKPVSSVSTQASQPPATPSPFSLPSLHGSQQQQQLPAKVSTPPIRKHAPAGPRLSGSHTPGLRLSGSATPETSSPPIRKPLPKAQIPRQPSAHSDLARSSSPGRGSVLSLAPPPPPAAAPSSTSSTSASSLSSSLPIPSIPPPPSQDAAEMPPPLAAVIPPPPPAAAATQKQQQQQQQHQFDMSVVDSVTKSLEDISLDLGAMSSGYDPALESLLNDFAGISDAPPPLGPAVPVASEGRVQVATVTTVSSDSNVNVVLSLDAGRVDEEKKRKEEEERKRLEEEEERKKKEEEEKIRKEEERKRREEEYKRREEERKKREEEDRKRLDENHRLDAARQRRKEERQKMVAGMKKKEEEEKKRQEERQRIEAEKMKKEEEQKKKLEAEQKKKFEEEQKKKLEEERQKQEEEKRKFEEERKKQEEEERRRQEEERRRLEEEERKRQEEERKRLEEEERLRKEEEERIRKEQEEKKRQEEERRKKEEELSRIEAERKKKREERQRQFAEMKKREEEELRKQEEERKRIEEEELRKQEEERKRIEEEERKRIEEEERKRAEEEERKRAEEERKKKASMTRPFELEKTSVRSTLGCGALGDTHKISYAGDRNDYTLKILRPQPSGESADGAATIAAVKREICRLSHIKRHPNVLPVAGICAEGLSLGYVSGYATGPAVTEFTRVLRAKDKLPERLKIAQGIANGLAHLHTLGILHGTLKPADIILSGELEPMLRDYGFLFLKEQRLGSGLVLDPFYVAPEIRAAAAATASARNATGAIPFTVQSDLYSLGVVLWQIFEGGEKDVAAAEQHRSCGKNGDDSSKRCLRLRYTATPAEIASVIERCCRPEPGARPASAAEVARELGELKPEGLHVGELPAELREKHDKLNAVAQKVIALLQSPQAANVLHGVRAVGVLGQAAENVPSIWEEGIHMCLVRRLAGDEDLGVVEAVVRQLQDLCDRVGDEFRRELARVIPPEILLGLIRREYGTRENDAVLARVLTLVATLLREDCVRRGLYAHGATRALLKHMCSPADMVAMNATRAMENYLKLAEARDSFIGTKGLEFVAALLRRAAGNPGITVFLFGVIAHLFQNETAVPGLLELGAVDRFRTMLGPRAGLLALAAAKCVAKYAASPAARAAHPGEEWTPLVIPLLASPAPRIRAYACLTLARFATTDEFCDTLESAGIIPTLLTLLEPDDGIDINNNNNSINSNNNNSNSIENQTSKPLDSGGSSAAEVAERRRDCAKLNRAVLELLTRLSHCISCRDTILDSGGMERVVGFYSAYAAQHPEDYSVHLACTRLLLALVADNDSAMEALCEHSDDFAQRLVRQLAVAVLRCNASGTAMSGSTATVGSAGSSAAEELNARDTEYLLATLRLVAALSAGSSAVVDVVLRAGGLTAIVGILEASQGHMVAEEEVPATAGAALAALLHYDSTLEELERIPRGFGMAFGLLGAQFPAHVKEALLAQLYTRSNGQQATLLLLVRMGLLGHLATFLRDLANPVQLQSKALQIVILALKTPELKEDLVKSGVAGALNYLAVNSVSPIIKSASQKVCNALKN